MLSKLRTKMTEERGESVLLLIHVSLKKYPAQGLIGTAVVTQHEGVDMCTLTAPL